MPGVFVVPNVRLGPARPYELGLIGDRQCWGMINGANGRNFTNANVARVGGLGAVIDPRQSGNFKQIFSPYGCPNPFTPTPVANNCLSLAVA